MRGVTALVSRAGEDRCVRDDLTGLGPLGFERMCQALAACALGPGIEAFGGGADGGREASFSGLHQYPSLAAPWRGYGVLQAKYKDRLLGTGTDTTWLRRQVKAELDAWADPDGGRTRDGRRPEYLIFATNVPLSGVAGRGGKDRIDKLIRDYSAALGLKDWRVWDAAQIETLLNTYPQVRRAFAALITPSEVLAAMRDRQETPPEVRVVLNTPPATIRPGQPGNEAAFLEAYTAAGGMSRLGQAIGEVSEQGPGWVQHFDGGPGGAPAVICAGYGRPAVAVAGPVWRALCAVGVSSRGGGTAGAGLPTGAIPPASFLGPGSAEIELDGGTWGPGMLVRRQQDQWAWQPRIAFDSEAFRDRDAWSSRDLEKDLRLRVAARIPVAASGLRITGAGRARLEAALRQATLNEVLLALAARYGLKGGALEWEEMPELTGHNNSRFASYHALIPGPGDRLAMLACLWFMLPGSVADVLSCVVDLRVDFDAIRPSPSAAPTDLAQILPDLRVTRSELASFFAQAWQLATMTLPLAATASPAELPPAGAPRLELYIQNERPKQSGKPRPLRTLDMIDLSDFGQPRRNHLDVLSVGITAPLGLPGSKITALVSDVMTRMADDFGFTGVHAPTPGGG
jgi:hypothetical protein